MRDFMLKAWEFVCQGCIEVYLIALVITLAWGYILHRRGELIEDENKTKKKEDIK